jgi:hypothetical protein
MPDMRIKPLDAIAFLGIPLAVVGMIAENTFLVACAFLASSVVMALAVAMHEKLSKKLRVVVCIGVFLGFGIAFKIISDRNSENELGKNVGVLFPLGENDNTVTISNCSTPLGALRVIVGSNLAWGTHFPMDILLISGRQSLRIDRRQDGSILITQLEVFDDKHNVVVSINGNSLWVEPSSRRLRPNVGSMVVYDHNNENVLDLHFVNSTLLKMNGIFRLANGQPIRFTDTSTMIGTNTLSGNCAGESRQAFSFS